MISLCGYLCTVVPLYNWNYTTFICVNMNVTQVLNKVPPLPLSVPSEGLLYSLLLESSLINSYFYVVWTGTLLIVLHSLSRRSNWHFLGHFLTLFRSYIVNIVNIVIYFPLCTYLIFFLFLLDSFHTTFRIFE